MTEKLRLMCQLCLSKNYQVIFPPTPYLKSYLTAQIFSARRLPDRVHGTIVRCDKCGLVRTLETINPRKLKVLYQRSSFTYQNITDNLKTAYGWILADASQLTKKTSFLEIGCGNGFLLEKAKQLGYKMISGIEPSYDAINQAPLKIKPLIKTDILRPRLFNNSSFDLIAAFQVFDHIPDPNRFLKICFSLLKPNGILLLLNHDVDALSAKLLGEKSPIYDIEHPFLYSQNTLSEMLKKNNYRVLKTYSPPTLFSLRYLLRLLPIPKVVKEIVNHSNNKLFDVNLKIFPGNLAIYAQK